MDMAKRLGDELGLPSLRENAFKLNQRVFNTPVNNLRMTTGSDVNQNQLNNINSYDLQKLVPLAQNATAQQQNAEGSLATLLGYTQADWQRELAPYAYEKDINSEFQAREATMFSKDNENELNSLIAKMNAGVTLNEGEKNRANQLAIAEKGYQQALEVARMNNQFKNVDSGGLYNTQSGSFAVKPSLSTFLK